MADGPSKPNVNRITVGLADELTVKLERYAEVEGVSKAWVLRRALIDFLDKRTPQRELPIIHRD